MTPPLPDDAARADRETERRQAALMYAGFGWPVLPGSDWNGRRWQVPHGQGSPTDGVRPIEPRNYATIDPEIITGWWSRGGLLSPSVLLRTGVFDVLSVPAAIGDIARGNPKFAEYLTPVLIREDTGREYFLTYPAPEKVHESKALSSGAIELQVPGSWVLVPPADLGHGKSVRWIISPEVLIGTVAPFFETLGVLKDAETEHQRGNRG